MHAGIPAIQSSLDRATRSGPFAAIRRSIALRLLLPLIGVTIPLLVGSIWVSYASSISILDAERENSESRIAYLGANELGGYFKGLDSILLSSFRSNRFMTNLSPEPDDFSNASQNEDFLKSILYADDDIQYVYLFTLRDRQLLSLSKQMSARHPFPEADGVDWVRRPQQGRSGLYIGPPGPFVNHRNIGTVGGREVFIMSRRLFDIETDATLGVLAIAVSTGKARSILAKIQAYGETLLLYGPEGSMFLDDGARYDAKSVAGLAAAEGLSQRRARLGADSCLVTSIGFEPGFKMVMALPIGIIRSSATRSLRIGIVALIVLSLALLATVAAVVYPFVSAIKRLSGAMRNSIEDGFRFDRSSLPPGGRDDEIGALRDGFEAMMDRIDRLINLEYKARIENQEARLRALQSQIDPHFINNALQSIGTLALRNGSRDVYGSILSLSRMIGYSTDPSVEGLPLKSEIEQVKRYVGLQGLRFGERLQVSFAIGPGAPEAIVPRLILQPIVENSIEHGMDESLAGLSIRIEASVSMGLLSLSVADSGAGIGPEELAGLRAGIGSAISVVGQREHIGLRNVAERIRLFSGDRGRLLIDSKRGEGTTVRLELPLEEASGGRA